MIGSSVGAIYATIANLPRDLVFKQRNTSLLCVIPGPKEPGADCFARILEPIVADLQRCEAGVGFFRGEQQLTFTTRVLLFASDLLAAKKLIGTISHAHKLHPCHQCATPLSDINTPAGYDWRNFKYHPPEVLLQAAFEYERADPHRRQEIEDAYGVRFSPFLRLIGMDHGHSSPVDGLHNSFLGIAKSFVNMTFQRKVFGASLLDDYKDDEFGEDARIEAFCAVFESATYPGHLGRLPSRVTKQFARADRDRAGSGLKADQWKRIAQLLLIALFMGLK